MDCEIHTWIYTCIQMRTNFHDAEVKYYVNITFFMTLIQKQPQESVTVYTRLYFLQLSTY